MSGPVVLKGGAIAQRLRDSAAQEAARLKGKGIVPKLASVLAAGAGDARAYADSQRRACEKAGIEYAERLLEASASQADLLALVEELKRDGSVTGVFLHEPMPAGLDLAGARMALGPGKDVEGMHPALMGMLALGEPVRVPCTAAAVAEILRECGVPLAGADLVIVGRSPIVGRALALLLLTDRKAPTVTVCHSATADLAAQTRRADFLVVAMGKPAFIKAGMVREGAVVVDVGTNVVKGPDGSDKLVGDVAFDEVAPKCRVITPVPGGVGPVTTACLLRNIVACAERGAGGAAPGW